MKKKLKTANDELLSSQKSNTGVLGGSESNQENIRLLEEQLNEKNKKLEERLKKLTEAHHRRNQAEEKLLSTKDLLIAAELENKRLAQELQETRDRLSTKSIMSSSSPCPSNSPSPQCFSFQIIEKDFSGYKTKKSRNKAISNEIAKVMSQTSSDSKKYILLRPIVNHRWQLRLYTRESSYKEINTNTLSGFNNQLKSYSFEEGFSKDAIDKMTVCLLKYHSRHYPEDTKDQYQSLSLS